jgi:hypothetical protein
MREALLLDLGALVFELHRQGKRAPALLQQKASELSAVDAEVRSLEEALGAGGNLDRLQTIGVLESCVACGSLLGPGDDFCAACGAPAWEEEPHVDDLEEHEDFDQEEPVDDELADEDVEVEDPDAEQLDRAEGPRA